jgi:F0F1-type ATP synthase membrane subunit b/b'
VQRREERKQARQAYKEKKKAAKQEYKEEKKSANAKLKESGATPAAQGNIETPSTSGK